MSENETPIEISVIATTYANMGDHAEFVSVAYEVKAGETVSDLVARVLPRNKYQRRDGDYITLRAVQPAEPTDFGGPF